MERGINPKNKENNPQNNIGILKHFLFLEILIPKNAKINKTTKKQINQAIINPLAINKNYYD